MNIYIWRDVANLTNKHHDGGGVVVVAPTLDRAREIIRDSNRCVDEWHTEPGGEHWSDCGPRTDCEALTAEPDAIYPTTDDQHVDLYVFKNAGCC
jgi:hypothetical protein